MARIRTFIAGELQRATLHDEIDAYVYEFERDGKKLMQINTVGSGNREIVGKVSQSIQLDEAAGRVLFDRLANHFGFKR